MQSHYLRRLAGITFMTVLLSACLETEESEFEKQVSLEESIIEDHLQRNGLTATRDNSGIYYQVISANPEGQAVEADDVVFVKYWMSSLAGAHIDSLDTSLNPDTAVVFQHSNAALYPQGINQGIRLMNEGERFRLYLPSYLAFGAFSYKTLLPAESILVTDIEVTEVTNREVILQKEEAQFQDYIEEQALDGVEKQANGIYYQLMQAGEGKEAKAGNTVKLHYKGYYLDGEVFDETKSDQPAEVYLGSSSQRLIEGFEEALKLMKEGEKARIMVPSDMAYGSGIQVIPSRVRSEFLKAMNLRDIEPFQPMIFEIEVLEIR
jgi:FKBP-type peptidyl-prolyl cis-trans isomerase